jgi:hypothetical protein
MDSILTQLQTLLTPILLAAATAFLGWLFTALKSHFGIAAADSAEAAVRTAASTEAGKIAATIPAATVAIGAAPATIVPSGTLIAAASKIINDLPAEVKLTGYNGTDIADMVLANLPGLLGALNPALGAVAGVAAGIVKSAIEPHVS